MSEDIERLVRTVADEGGVRLETLNERQAEAERLGVDWKEVLNRAFAIVVKRRRAAREQAPE